MNSAAKKEKVSQVETRAELVPVSMSGYAVAQLPVILPINVCVRTSKYLNNLIEQDHRRVKQRVYPMLGFEIFGNAAVTISGIELAQKIKKGQFDTSDLRLEGARVQELWQAILAA